MLSTPENEGWSCGDTQGGREEVVDNVCGESDQGLVLVNQEL